MIFDMIFDTRHALAKVSQLPAKVSRPPAEVSRLPARILNVMAELPDVPTKPREQADHQPRQGDPDGQNCDEKGHRFRSHAVTIPDGPSPRNRPWRRAPQAQPATARRAIAPTRCARYSALA